MQRALGYLFLLLTVFSCSDDAVDFALTINEIGNGSVLEEELDSKTVQLTAVPDSGHQFLGWSGDATGTENPIEISLDKNKIITATFEVTDILEIQVSEGGVFEKSIVSSDNGVIVYELRAIASSGYEFVSWKHGNEVHYAEDFTLQIENETTIYLDFTNTSLPFQYNKLPIVDLGNETIWGLDVITNDHLIFTTKTGKIYASKNGQTSMVSGYYEALVNSSGQGGLLDIKLDPDYEVNKYVYVTYSERISGSNFSYLSLDRFKYENDQISDVMNIFKTGSQSQRTGHFGSRIAFSDHHLFISIGEGSPSVGGANSAYKNAQDLTNDWGKIHRLNIDGSVPLDNPFYSSDDTRQTIYSYGHRNPQGLMFDPYTSSIISTEHGPRGGDELNVINSGLNYGWPLVSYGINYNGSDISGKTHEGYENPVFYWDPSIATSQLISLRDKSHKSWFRNILVAGLKSQSVFRLKLEDGMYQQVERIQLGYRVRSISEGENGVFFVSSDSGSIVKFTPAN